jgi:hypothetical protein
MYTLFTCITLIQFQEKVASLLNYGIYSEGKNA